MRATWPRLKGCLINALLVISSLGVALAISESALRLREAWLLDESAPPWDIAREFAANGLVQLPAEAFAWRPDGNGLIHERSQDPKLVYELRPNVRLNEYISINSFGCRDDAFSIEKPDGVCRIVIVGDSVAFGWNDAQEFIFANALEEMLNALTPGERRFEVCNLSVGGYNAQQELEVIRKKVPRLHPDFLVLQYCTNDDLIGADAGLYHHFKRSCLRTWDFIALHLDILRERLHPGSMLDTAYQDIRAAVQENHWPFLVLAMPDENAANPGILALLDRLHLAYLNPEGAFDACDKKRIFCDPLHLTSFGHRIVAEELYRYLANEAPCVETARNGREIPDFGPVRNAFQAGMDAQDREDVAEAARRYQEAVSLDGGYKRLAAKQLTLIARRLLAGSTPGDALPFAQDAVSLAPGATLSLQALGLAAQARGLYTEAVTALENAVRLAPDSASLWGEVSLARTLNQDAAGADAAFTKMRERLPDKTPEQRRISLTSLLKFNGAVRKYACHTLALKAANAAVALEPGNPAALESQKNSARETFVQMTARAPESPTEPSPATQEFLSDVRGAFRNLVDATPEVPEYHAYLGMALLVINDTAAGWEELGKTAFPDIHTAPAAFYLAQLYRRHGNAALAEEGYLRTLELEPTYFGAAKALYDLHRDPSGQSNERGYWETIATRLPNSTHVQFFLGIAALRAQALDEAMAAFSRAISLFPGNSGAWRFTGEIHLRKNEFPQAEAAFREALRLDPAIEGASEGLARALSKQ